MNREAVSFFLLDARKSLSCRCRRFNFFITRGVNFEGIKNEEKPKDKKNDGVLGLRMRFSTRKVYKRVGDRRFHKAFNEMNELNKNK